MKALKALLLLTSILNFACSYQYRTMDTDDNAVVMESYNQVIGAIGASSSSTDLEQFKQLASLQEAGIYYADNISVYGPALSIASFQDLSLLGRADLIPEMLAEIRIFFVDAFTTQGRQAGLLIAYRENGKDTFDSKVFLSTRPVEVVDGEFFAIMGSGGQEQFTLRSMYLDEDDELEAIIRLQVHQIDSLGYEQYIGQFSTLVWYQN